MAGSAAVAVVGADRPEFRAIDPNQLHENAEIAARLKARDPQILDELILQYQHRLMRYLAHLTGNRELAEDLFQETWMRVLVRGPQFRGNSQFVTWLFTIARNLVFDMKRRGSPTKSFEEMTEMGDERLLHRATREQTPFDHYAALESERLITQSFSALTPQQREVFVLRFRAELPLQEIAAVTGIPLSTVKARLYRGLAVLKSHVTHARVSGHHSVHGTTSGTGPLQSPLIPQWLPA